MAAKIQKKENSLRIRIPVKKNPYVIIPMLLLCILWIPSLGYFVSKSLIMNDLIIRIVWLFLLVATIASGAILLTILFWMLFGHEEIYINKTDFVTMKPLVFYVRNNYYKTTEIKNLRIDKESYKKKINNEWKEDFRTIISFSVPEKQVIFGRGIDIHDAELILINLASSSFLDDRQFYTIHKG